MDHWLPNALILHSEPSEVKRKNILRSFGGVDPIRSYIQKDKVNIETLPTPGLPHFCSLSPDSLTGPHINLSTCFV